MKIFKIIALAALVFSGQAKADCQEYVLNRFVEVRENAVKMNDPTLSEEIKKIKASFVEGGQTFYGQYQLKGNHVEFPTDLCELPVEFQNRVIAHEIGHAVAFMIYPELKKEVFSDLRVYNEDVHERMADQFGSRLLENDLNHKIIDEASKQCTATKKLYFCDIEVNWAYALTH